MALEPRSTLREVSGISPEEKLAIEYFMQGAIYSWVKNRPDHFAVRDLVGGVNTDWGGTPLQVLFEKHIRLGKNQDEAFTGAAKDLGWIVKGMIDRDQRTFSYFKAGMVNHYRWED